MKKSKVIRDRREEEAQTDKERGRGRETNETRGRRKNGCQEA